MFKVVADSCCDPYAFENGQVSALPAFFVTIDGITYTDDGSVSSQTIIDKMKASKDAPSTACPSPDTFAQAISGDVDTFVIALSAKLSGSYQSAVSSLQLKTGTGRVHIFDSKSASAGEILIAHELFECIKSGMTFEQIVEKVEHFIENMSTIFVLESLDNLIKNGRMSRLVGQVATVLNLRPVMGANDGEIVLLEKARGTKAAMEKLVGQVAKKAQQLKDAGETHETLVITYCGCKERAEHLRDEIYKKVDSVKKIIVVATGVLSTVYANQGGIIVGY